MTTPGAVHDDAAGRTPPVPGPRKTVLRALPACAPGLVGVPLLALLVPRNTGRDWWALGIILAVLAVVLATAALASRGLPRTNPDVSPTRWQNALVSARVHRSLPSDPLVRMTAARMAYDRVLAGTAFAFLWAGIAGGALVRPDLNWISPLGGLIAVSVIGWARLPSAWAYLRLCAGSG